MGINNQKKRNSVVIGSTLCCFLILIMLNLFNYKPAKGQSGVHGVLQNYLAVQTARDHEFLAARNRLRFQFEKPTDFGGLSMELDAIHRFDKNQDVNLLLKEAYFDWYIDKYDLRIGHQKIIWGRANGTFITDIITPVDLREFLTVSAEDIRFGITSLNAVRYFGSNSIQIVFAPFFQPDLLPSVQSRWFPSQNISSVFSIIPVTSSREDQAYTIRDIQLALRYSLLSPTNLDLDFFLLRWAHPTPAYDLSLSFLSPEDLFSIELIESYQNSWMTGLSSSLKLNPNLFFLAEALFVQKKLFTTFPVGFGQTDDAFDVSSIFELVDENAFNNNGFLTTKPWIHSMAGIRTEISKTAVEAQFFVEGIFNYDEQIIQEEVYKYATLLATRSFLRNRLQILTLSRYNLDTEDFWIQLQGNYEMNDNLHITLGTNLFGGQKTDELSGHVSFSQFRENSFIFSKIALFF